MISLATLLTMFYVIIVQIKCFQISQSRELLQQLRSSIEQTNNCITSEQVCKSYSGEEFGICMRCAKYLNVDCSSTPKFESCTKKANASIDAQFTQFIGTSPKGGSGLSEGAQIGIYTGIGVGALLIIFIIYKKCKSRDQRIKEAVAKLAMQFPNQEGLQPQHPIQNHNPQGFHHNQSPFVAQQQYIPIQQPNYQDQSMDMHKYPPQQYQVSPIY